MEELGPFDQLPFLRTYTLMMLCFSLPPSVDRSELRSRLFRAAQTLTSSFPFLAGQVIREPSTQEGPQAHSGTYQIRPYKRPSENDSVCLVKDVSDTSPGYDQIYEARAPASLLDGHTLAPLKGQPDHYTDSDPQPVLVIQANWVQGGLLLCFAGMHMVMDGNGLGQIIRLFAKACRGEDFSVAEIQNGNLPRANAVPPLALNQTPMLHPELRRCTSNATTAAYVGHCAEPDGLFWTYFRFSAASLVKLKEKASEGCQTDRKWISTNDAVSALLWRALSVARASHLPPQEPLTLLRAVNGRRCLNPPVADSYTGNMVAGAFASMSRQDLTHDLSLSAIALHVRKATLSNDDHYIRSLAHLIRSEPDKTTIAFEVDRADRDLIISSWAHLSVFESFGDLLGTPDFLRRPTLTPSEGYAYLMPKDLDGNIDVTLSLREIDLARMKGDRIWMSYAEWLG